MTVSGETRPARAKATLVSDNRTPGLQAPAAPPAGIHAPAPQKTRTSFDRTNISTAARNVEIPTITIQILKQPQGNYVRHCRETTTRSTTCGRTTSRHAEPHINTPGATGVEGAGGSGGPGRGAGGWRQGQGGPRDRPLRAQLACGDLAGGPPPTGTHSGRAPKRHNGAPGVPAAPQATRDPGRAGHAAPRTPAAPQAPPEPRQTALTLRRRRARGVPCS